MPTTEFAAVIVTYNSAGHIWLCLSSLQNASASIVVVDNGSSDDTVSIIKRDFPGVWLIAANENLGYGKALNRGIAETRLPLVLAANADTVFPQGSMQALADFLAQHIRVGVAGPQEIFPDGSWQRSYGDVPGIGEALKTLLGATSIEHTARRMLWRLGRTGSVRRVGYVDGAVMMIRRAAFDAVRGFDETFPHYCEDADFCLRVRQAGWDVVTVPAARVTHVRGGSSTKREGYSDKFLRALAISECHLIRKHHPVWHVAIYRQACILHGVKMALIYRLLRGFHPASRRPHASVMVSAFERWARLWRELET